MGEVGWVGVGVGSAAAHSGDDFQNVAGTDGFGLMPAFGNDFAVFFHGNFFSGESEFADQVGNRACGGARLSVDNAVGFGADGGHGGFGKFGFERRKALL